MFITHIHHKHVEKSTKELYIKQLDISVNKEKQIIPLNIFQTWHTLDLPSDMKNCVDALKQQNPEFTHYLYDDTMIREFIKTHFDEDVLYALDKLKPGAYKADLWRYCVLYIHGGIYLDIKYKCINSFKLISLTDKEYWTRDRFGGIFQALMINKPGNTVLLQAIRQIVKNVKEEYYGNSCLDVTGPQLLKEFITNDEIQNSNTSISTLGGLYIKYKHQNILKSYDNYRAEQKNTGKTECYGKLWRQRDIYNKNVE